MKLSYITTIIAGMTLASCGSSSVQLPFEGEYVEVDTSCGASLSVASTMPAKANPAFDSIRIGKGAVRYVFRADPCEFAYRFPVKDFDDFKIYYGKAELISETDSAVCKDAAKIMSGLAASIPDSTLEEYAYEKPILELRNPKTGQCSLYRRK